MNVITFPDRAHAGRLLAEALMRYANQPDVLVLALPKGGVPVAHEVAKALNAPLDVVVVRKVGVPGNDELALGAVASGNVRVIHNAMVRALGIKPEEVERAVADQLQEVRRRELLYRGREGAPDVAGKIAILVDDGMATGSTLRAGVECLRQQEPKAIIAAVPTASEDACVLLEPLVDELVALQTPQIFHAVGQWYDDFAQATDSEVADLLASAAAAQPPSGAST